MKRLSDENLLPPSTLEYARAPHIALDYDATFAHSRLFKYDCRLLEEWFARPGRLVDFGCGTGRHVLFFASRGFEVTGVDLSRHMLDVCRRKLRLAELEADLVQEDFARYGPADGRLFDYALSMFSTLGMVRGHENRVECLRAMRRCVRPGGLLALHAHNALHDAWRPLGPFWLLGALLWVKANGLRFGDRIINRYRKIPRMYIHLFRDEELRAVLAEAGWQVEETVYLNRLRCARLRPFFLAGVRANGFIVRARNPG